MGSPMVYNLLKAGYEVSVYTRTKSKAETVLDAGAQWIDQINDLAGMRIFCAPWSGILKT